MTNEKATKSVYRYLNPRPLDIWAAASLNVLKCSALRDLIAVALSLAVSIPLAEAVAKSSFRCQ